jgi:hypothetical protein
MDNLKICPKCNYLGAKADAVCPSCGLSLISRCPRCGAKIKTPFAEYCYYCGVKFETLTGTPKLAGGIKTGRGAEKTSITTAIRRKPSGCQKKKLITIKKKRRNK